MISANIKHDLVTVSEKPIDITPLVEEFHREEYNKSGVGAVIQEQARIDKKIINFKIRQKSQRKRNPSLAPELLEHSGFQRNSLANLGPDYSDKINASVSYGDLKSTNRSMHSSQESLKKQQAEELVKKMETDRQMREKRKMLARKKEQNRYQKELQMIREEKEKAKQEKVR